MVNFWSASALSGSPSPFLVENFEGLLEWDFLFAGCPSYQPTISVSEGNTKQYALSLSRDLASSSAPFGLGAIPSPLSLYFPTFYSIF